MSEIPQPGHPPFACRPCASPTPARACPKQTSTRIRLSSSSIGSTKPWKRELLEPNAMTLATVSPDGRPSARIVLLKEIEGRDFVFYTNYESRKGQELAANPYAALVFYWAELERQVRIEGEVGKVSRAQSEAYFATRPRGSQLGAWASQSEPGRGFQGRAGTETRGVGGAVPGLRAGSGTRVLGWVSSSNR